MISGLRLASLFFFWVLALLLLRAWSTDLHLSPEGQLALTAFAMFCGGLGAVAMLEQGDRS